MLHVKDTDRSKERRQRQGENYQKCYWATIATFFYTMRQFLTLCVVCVFAFLSSVCVFYAQHYTL